MTKLTRVRVTHQVAATRAGGQGVHNVILLDERGKPQRHLGTGEPVIVTFSASPSYIRGPVPREISDNPLLLLEPATERDLAREPGPLHMFAAPIASETAGAAAPLPPFDETAGEVLAPAAGDVAGSSPAAPAPGPAPDPAMDRAIRRNTLRAELAALPWPDLLARAAAAEVPTHRRKRAQVEAALLDAELRR